VLGVSSQSRYRADAAGFTLLWNASVQVFVHVSRFSLHRNANAEVVHTFCYIPFKNDVRL